MPNTYSPAHLHTYSPTTRWVFSLAPQPAGKPPYVLTFDAVGDRGTLPPAVLQARLAGTLTLTLTLTLALTLTLTLTSRRHPTARRCKYDLSPYRVQARRAKEAASLRAFVGGDLIRISRLSELHAWLHTRHSAYTAAGILSKAATLTLRNPHPINPITLTLTLTLTPLPGILGKAAHNLSAALSATY